MLMQGMTVSSIKKHPALIPLYVCVGAGCVAATLYGFRLAARSPDVSWNKRTNPEPWNEYKNKQYKFYSTQSNAESPAPEF